MLKRFARWILRDEIVALSQRLSQASGALSDIRVTVTNIGRGANEETQKLAEAVLERSLCSADRPHNHPSWYVHPWEERLWSSYDGRYLTACASNLSTKMLAKLLFDDSKFLLEGQKLSEGRKFRYGYDERMQ